MDLLSDFLGIEESPQKWKNSKKNIQLTKQMSKSSHENPSLVRASEWDSRGTPEGLSKIDLNDLSSPRIIGRPSKLLLKHTFSEVDITREIERNIMNSDKLIRGSEFT